MKHYFKYISFIIAALASVSCSLKENWDPIGAGHDGYVEFVVRPTSFVSYDLSGAQTKAFAEGLTDIEKRVHNAFFLIFDINGNLYGEYQALEVDKTSSVISSHKLKLEVSNADITACVIANVPESIVKQIKTLDDLANKPLSLQYATVSEAGYFGVPKIDLNYTPTTSTTDDTMCFPMVGIYKGPLKSDNATIQIPLKRLFAKVNVTLSMDMGTNLLEGVLGGTLNDYIGDILGGLQIGNTAENARFEMNGYSLHNLPTQVRLAEYPRTEDGSQPTVESAWVKESGKFENHLNMTLDDPTIYDKSNPSETVKKTFSFSFYTPEYALLPDAAKVNASSSHTNPERFKATLFDASKHPLSLSIEGRLHDHGGTYADVIYNVYFGEDNFDSFSLFRNSQYNNTLTIKGAGHLSKGETIDNRVEVLPLNLVDAYDQAANCYIISIPGTYELDTYKGAIKNITASSPKASGTPVTVWNESTNTITYDTEKSKDGLIVFTVDNSTGNIQPGNAVIAAKSGDDIQWSWHLWFCEPDSRPDNTDYQHTYPSSGAKVMNRSLGATDNGAGITSSLLNILRLLGYDWATWQDGLYYQWGRKDPLRLNAEGTGVYDSSDYEDDGTASGASYDKSVKNPKVFYSDWTGTYTNASDGWTTTKSVNDPCPPGYKVPAHSIWRYPNSDEDYSVGYEGLSYKTTNTSQYTFNLSRSGDSDVFIFFPYFGYIDSQAFPGNLVKAYDETIEYHDPTFEFESVGLLTVDKYKDIILSVTISHNMGGFWASNEDALLYGYASVSLSEVQDRIKLKSATKQTKTWWGGYGNDTPVTTMSDNDFRQMIVNMLATNRNIEEYLYDKLLNKTSTPSNAYHVRCVRDE